MRFSTGLTVGGLEVTEYELCIKTKAGDKTTEWWPTLMNAGIYVVDEVQFFAEELACKQGLTQSRRYMRYYENMNKDSWAFFEKICEIC